MSERGRQERETNARTILAARVHTHNHTHTTTRTHTNTHIHAKGSHTHNHTHNHTTCTQTHKHTHAHSRTNTHTHTHSLSLSHTHTHTHTHTHSHTQWPIGQTMSKECRSNAAQNGRGLIKCMNRAGERGWGCNVRGGSPEGDLVRGVVVGPGRPVRADHLRATRRRAA
jgi:hypothetical protein